MYDVFCLVLATCHVFGSSKTTLITFDGMRHEFMARHECEYVLARQRTVNDTFAVTYLGNQVRVYLNGTTYTLDSSGLKIDHTKVSLPFEDYKVVNVRHVTTNGHMYTRFTAWAGVDMFYTSGGVHLSVNPFYRNQTTGWCGNANYDRSHVDEMIMPNGESTMSAENFIESWKVDTMCMSPKNEMPAVREPLGSDLMECENMLLTVLKAGHIHTDVYHFYNTCVHDATLGINPKVSIRAYLLATHAKEIDVESTEL